MRQLGGEKMSTNFLTQVLVSLLVGVISNVTSDWLIRKLRKNNKANSDKQNNKPE